MPIFEWEGTRYNVKEEDVEKFASKYPESTTIEEREGKKYRIKSKDYQAFKDRFDNGVKEAPHVDFSQGLPPIKSSLELPREDSQSHRNMFRGINRLPSLEAQLTKGIREGMYRQIEEQEKPISGFWEGVEQGGSQLKRGLQYFGGELANLVTGSSEDDKAILDNWDKVVEYYNIDKTPLEKRREIAKEQILRGKGLAIMDKDEQEKLYEQAKYLGELVESTGSIENAKKEIERRSKDMSWGDKQRESARQVMNSYRPTEGWGWIGETGVQIVPAVASIAASLYTKNPRLASWIGKGIGHAGMAGMSLSTAGSSMKEARDAGATNGEVWGVGLANAGIEYITEKIPFDRYTGKLFNRAGKKIGAELSQEVMANGPVRQELGILLSKANKKLGGKLFGKKNVKEYLSNIAAEGASEFTAEALQTITPMIYKNPEEYPTLSEIIANGWEGAKAGLFMGSVIGGTSKIAEHKQNKSRRKSQGYVDVAEFNKDGESVIGEVVGIDVDAGKFEILHDGKLSSVSKEDITDGHRFSYEEFVKGQIDKLQTEKEIIKEAEQTSNSPLVHRDSGMIEEAIMKTGDRKVYIIKGRVVPYSDGNGVDASESDESIIVYDAERGTQEQISPEALLSVSAPISPEEITSGSSEVAEIDSYISSLEEETSEAEENEAEEPISVVDRVPRDERGNLLYEQVDSDTAWDAIIEQTEGDEIMAQTVADSMVADKEAALKKLEKSKPKGGVSIEEKIASEKEHKAAIERARQELEAWKNIAFTATRRSNEIEAKERRLAEGAAQRRKVEEERLRAEREEAERIERESLMGVPDILDDKPQAARARGFRRVSGHKIDRQAPIKGLQGKEISVKFSDDAIANGRVAVIEAQQLQPSHIDGHRNPLHFIDEAQPKERNDEASVMSARKIAGNIRPEEITSSVTAYTGAPTVNSRGEAIQGNNRSTALRQMWEEHQEEANKYKQYLIDHAEDFGLNADDVAAMERPVLVNMLDVEDTEAIKLGQYVAQDTESGGTERIKPKNAVQRMGSDMRKFANILLSTNEEDISFAGLIDKNGEDVLRWMSEQGYINPTQYKSAFDSRGNLTSETKNDLRGIMYQSIFQGGNSRLEEMFNLMPIKAQRAILATAFRDYDSPNSERMIEEIQNSIRAYYALSQSADFVNAKNYKEARVAVDGWKIQYQIDDVTGEGYLPADNFSNFALLLATMYKGENQSIIQGTFNKLYDLIQGTQEETLFDHPDNTPRTLAQAIYETLNITYDGQRRSNVLVGDSSASQRGHQGSTGDAATGERVENGEQTADSAGSIDGDSRGIRTDPEDRGNQEKKTDIPQTEEVIGRSLTADEAEDFIADMEENANTAPDVELTIENWDALFGEEGKVITPIGEVKMGENQFTKLMRQGRDGKLGMIKPTLEQPHAIVEDESEAKEDDVTERASSYVFIRSFKKADGSRYYYFTSVTVSKDGKEVVISNQEKRRKAIANLLINGKLVWKHADDVSTASDVADGLYSSQGNLSDPTTEGTVSPQTNISDSKDTTIYQNNNELGEKSAVPSVQEQIQAAEAEVNINPTEAQKEAGNYKKGHVQIGTFNVTIEQPKGSVRSGVDANGNKWETEMKNTYGYIRGTEGVDGDHIDVFLSDDIDGWNGRQVFVVDQYNEDGSFDEHKVMLGFNDIDEADTAYLNNYAKDWADKRKIVIRPANIEDFEKWIASSHRKTKPFAEYKSVQVAEKRANNNRLSEIKSRIEELHKEQETAHNRSDIFEEADELEREGVGSYTDDELALESDPVSKVLGKPRGTRKQRREFAQRERQRMAERVERLAKKLNLDNVEVVTDASTLTSSNQLPLNQSSKLVGVRSIAELEGKKQRAKGFYTKSTGKITIVIPNHSSAFDVEQTLLHEAVAHYGLRQLFGEHFDTFLDNVFNNAEKSISLQIESIRKNLYRKYVENAIKGVTSVFEQAEIIANLSKTEKDFTHTATEEYLASLAETTDFENTSARWWRKIKDLFFEMLEKIGFGNFSGVTMSDNELRYILWRSYENLREPGRHRSIFGEAADVVKQWELGVGQYESATGQLRVAEGEASAPSTMTNIEAVNKRFNEQLENLTEANARETIFDLGMPSEVLTSCGIENKPIRLYGSKVIAKSKKHGYTPIDLRNLPKSLNNPIAVFSGSQMGSYAILTEIQIDGKNVLVSIIVGKGGHDVDFNIITSAYGKNSDNITRWINDGKLLYADKTRALDYLSVPAPIAGAQNNQELVLATKIVKEFENRNKEEGTVHIDKLLSEYHQTFKGAHPTIIILKDKADLYEYAVSEGASEADAEEFSEQFIKEKSIGGYDPETNKIVIFAWNKGNYYATLFHEHVHYAIEQSGGIKHFETLVKELKELDPRLLHKVSQLYQEQEIDEEILTYSLETALYGEAFEDLSKVLSSEGQKLLEEILDKIGYEGRRNYGKEVASYEPDSNRVHLENKQSRTRRRIGERGGRMVRGGNQVGSEVEIPNGQSVRQTDETSGEDTGSEDNGLLSKIHQRRGEFKTKRGSAEKETTLSETINQRFNDELQQQIEGKLPQGHIYQLGMPSEVLLSCGISNAPIQLNSSRLKDKSTNFGHDYELSEIKDLVKALNNPIAIFAYGNKSKAQNIVVEIQHENKNFIIGLSIRPTVNGRVLDINSIRNIFPKDNAEWLNWISQGKAIFLNKEKIQDLIDQQRTNLADVEYLDLDSITKIVKEFENPNKIQKRGSAEKGDDVLYRAGEPEVRERVQARERYERRVKRGLFQSQEAIQDSMLSLKEAMESILGRKVYIEDVAGYENAYIGENRLSSVNKAECDGIAQLVFKPMLEEVAKLAHNEAERLELIDYMMAKHGLERNEDMREQAKQNGKTADRDFAGLTALTGTKDVFEAEVEAEHMVIDYEKTHDTSELWKKVKAVSKAILQKSYESGLISKETYDELSNRYEYYIPLRGFDEKTSNESYAYLSHKDSAFNAPIKKARGRSSKADDPFANLESMAESTIMQGNRNRLVKQRFFDFVMNHPSDLVSVSELWLSYNEAKDEWEPVVADNIREDDSAEEVERKTKEFESRMTQLSKQYPDRYKKGKDAIGIPYRVKDKGNLQEHQVIVKRGGVDYVLTVNGNPRLSQALNGLTNPDNDVSGAIGSFLRLGESLNRRLSAFYTTRNPDFVISNFLRDILYSNSMVWIKESPNYALRFHKNCLEFHPAKMRRLLSKYRRGELNMNDKTEAMFYRFMRNGGETGYVNIRDIERHKHDIKRELRKSQGRVPIEKAWEWFGERCDELNRSVENCARFAAFVTSREMGRSIDRAIYDAKEISVNFNKKGSGAKFFRRPGQTTIGNASALVSGFGRSSYVFWNAGIQGSTNFGRQIKRHPAKALTGMATMYLLGSIIAYMGMDDEEDKNAYYNLPEYVRRSNIMFRRGDHWISIPLPIEFRAIYGMGELMMSVMSGKERMTDGELAESIAGQVSQILPLDFMEGGGGWNAFVPSAAKPIIEAYITERSWTGLPLYKDNPWNEHAPEWTKAYSSANKYLVDLSMALNEASGGDEYRRGWFNFNPSKVEYLLKGYFGGVASTIDKMVKMGETWFGDREYDPRSFLLWNRIVKAGDERTAYRTVNREYYRLLEESEETKRVLRGYEQSTNKGVLEYAEKMDFLYNSAEYGRYEIYKEYQEYIDILEKMLDESSEAEEMKMLEVELNEVKKALINECEKVK